MTNVNHFDLTISNFNVMFWLFYYDLEMPI